uniref:Uncharacterized protein n=1 Tax=Amphimedon queenslandica TaxID=400682 RepID=A0A1X7UXH1_AMPQE
MFLSSYATTLAFHSLSSIIFKSLSLVTPVFLYSKYFTYSSLFLSKYIRYSASSLGDLKSSINIMECSLGAQSLTVGDPLTTGTDPA